MSNPPYKFIKLKTDDQWQPIKDVADQLSEERGTPIGMPAAVLEAITFFQKHRNNPYINKVTNKE